MTDKATQAAAGEGYAEPTGSATHYKIDCVADFLAVPVDRIDDCLAEFKDFLGLARDMKELTKTLGEVIGADGTSEVEGFTWIDDGKRDKSVTIKTIVEKHNAGGEGRGASPRTSPPPCSQSESKGD